MKSGKAPEMDADGITVSKKVLMSEERKKELEIDDVPGGIINSISSKIKTFAHGGPGSGNFGHAGIPGERGGSAPGGGGDGIRTRVETIALLKEYGYKTSELSGADLSEKDLHGIELISENLRGINLRGANLRNADLQGSRLQGADLSYSDLRGANLVETNLKVANLKGALLYGADFLDADLNEVDLRGVSFDGAKNVDREILDRLR